MANIVFNTSCGRVSEYANRVITNDPTNSVFLLLGYNSTATDATIRDLADVAAVEADANTAELTNSGYVRKTFNEAAITMTINNAADRTEVDVADQTWTAVAAGTNFTHLLFAYDSDSTTGTDSAVKPCTWHNFAVTTDGSDVTAQIADFFRAASAA